MFWLDYIKEIFTIESLNCYSLFGIILLRWTVDGSFVYIQERLLFKLRLNWVWTWNILWFEPWNVFLQSKQIYWHFTELDEFKESLLWRIIRTFLFHNLPSSRHFVLFIYTDKLLILVEYSPTLPYRYSFRAPVLVYKTKKFSEFGFTVLINNTEKFEVYIQLHVVLAPNFPLFWSSTHRLWDNLQLDHKIFDLFNSFTWILKLPCK